MKQFLIVLDSLGAGALPDAASFGDAGAHTLKSISKSEKFKIPNLLKMGLGNIEDLDFLGAVEQPLAAYGRAMERSRGKDTTVGHWELAGVVSEKPLPTYPNGFPQEVLERFTAATGYEVLCNQPYSGTEVIKDYGEESVQSGKLIVYTSADSVFQIAAHEEAVPLENLYEICRTARKILVGEHGVGRVIARPFTGTPGNYTRTANRRDFSLEPPAETLLDRLQKRGIYTVSVGKISDIFAGRGIDRSIPTHGNAEGMEVALKLAQEDFEGFVFVNLVDFDMLYGHRQDVDGYAAALSAFDAWLPSFLEKLRPEDRVIITADHGCDPGDAHTDHTREYIPVLCYGGDAENWGTLSSFTAIGEWIEDRFLLESALAARQNAYAPYSG
ncbi:MAG: phosphopentomutase, partial [Clostridia bacterium]|nr:phosphopentomutase [Clostridia bacterium]